MERRPEPREAVVDVVHRAFVASVDEETVHLYEKVVAGRSVNRPAWQQLVEAQNLLDDHEERPLVRAYIGPHGAGAGLDARQIVARVVESIDVIDAKAVHEPFAQQLEHEAVDTVEHGRIFHTDRGQLVDVEKTPVVDLLRGDPPMREPIGLLGEQRVEPVEAPGIATGAVEQCDQPLDVPADGGRFAGQRSKAALDDLLLAFTLGLQLAVHLLRRGQVPDSREEAEVLGGLDAVLAERLYQRVGIGAQDHLVAARRDRQLGLEVLNGKGTLVVAEHDFLTLEDRSVQVPQDRNEHLVVELGLERPPVDVEHRGISGAGPVLEHVLPPRVCRPGNPHVVRYQVDDVTHVASPERADPAPVTLEGADFRIELCGIGNIVPMRAAGHRFQVARCIDMRDAKCMQIVHDLCCIVEGERGVELQTVRREGDGRWH